MAGKIIDKNKIIPEKINIRDYAKFISKEGSVQEKRDILFNINTIMTLNNKLELEKTGRKSAKSA